jgi:hypothetical protein
MSVAERSVDNPHSTTSTWVPESVGGAVAVVLTILGLAHVAPAFLVAIALIAAGAALVLRGAAMVRDCARALQRSGEGSAPEVAGSGGLCVELLAGGAGIVLGILALLNVEPVDLVAVGVIALGGALVLTASATARLAGARIAAAYSDARAEAIANEITASSAAMQALAGLTAVVLGILALAGFSAVVLVLIALLTVGAFILLNGVSISGAVVTALRRL